MYDTTERAFTSDSESWDIFVGGITPEDFIDGFQSPESAVRGMLEAWQYEEHAPTWLKESLLRYIQTHLR